MESNPPSPAPPPVPPAAAAQPTPGTSWHARTPAEAYAALASRAEGLSHAEAADRLARLGPNSLPPPKGPGALLLLLWRQVRSPLVLVLLGTALLALALGKVTDGLVVLAVVVLNTAVGFVQEWRAGRAIASLGALLPERAVAVRGGHPAQVDVAHLVPGDVVVLQAGDRVPADLRVVGARGLRIEEAALTGEALPADKAVAPVGEEAVLGDRHSMAYSGTLVAAGTGAGLVVATGVQTELGRISQLLHEAEVAETPLTRQMEAFARVLTLAITVVAAGLMVAGMLRGDTFINALVAAITMAVAAIPEGLPAIITIALAIGVQRMARRHALVRHLPSVETLGATTVICSDKTGTLTRGEMTVRTLWTPEAGTWEVEGAGYAPEGGLRHDGHAARASAGVEALLRAGALCNDAHLEGGPGAWRITGDPTEGALVVAARKGCLDVEALRAAWPRLDVLPFSSERQLMATLHQPPEGPPVALLKGAPEVVVRHCGHLNGSAADVLRATTTFAGAGMRVLAVASKALPHGIASLPDDLGHDFTLLGLQAMIDPPRPEALQAVQTCHQAHIEVKMITGDHPATAHAIGQQFGLAGPDDAVVTGAELARLPDDALGAVARRHRVFARVAPEHKLRLVRALQQQGQTVAMTGDGVNDAPALKQANIGVSMGLAGTAVAREASDMVLTDDNFASVEAAVEEGRRIHDNLSKSLAFVLPTNVGEALIILGAVLFFPVAGGTLLLPMLPTQILWINLVATVTLALTLAFEAHEPGIMRRRPRPAEAPLLNRFVVVRTLYVAVLMAVSAMALFLFDYRALLAQGLAPTVALAQAQTVAVTTVVLFQCVYLLQCRSLTHPMWRIGLFTNPWVYVGIAALVGLQALFVYAPPLQELFGSAALGAPAWGRALLAALVVLPVVGLEKRLRRRHEAVAVPAHRLDHPR